MTFYNKSHLTYFIYKENCKIYKTPDFMLRVNSFFLFLLKKFPSLMRIMDCFPPDSQRFTENARVFFPPFPPCYFLFCFNQFEVKYVFLKTDYV